MSTIKEAIGNYLRYRRALNEVSRLDERMLADIGLRGINLKSALRAKDGSGARSNDHDR